MQENVPRQWRRGKRQSREPWRRGINEFDFRWNTRKMNDGDRTKLAVQGAPGKRLPYHSITQ